MPDEILVQGRTVAGDAPMKIDPEQRAYMLAAVGRWPEGTVFTVTVSRVRARVSDLQRAYWFAVVIPRIASYTGDDEDAVHDDLMRVFGPKVTKRWKNAKTGKRKQRVRRVSFSDLSTREATELIDRVRRDFGDQGLEIPEPDPGWRSRRRKAAAESNGETDTVPA